MLRTQLLVKICLLFIEHPNCRSCIIPTTEKVVIDKPNKSIKEEKALNKYGQEIQFNLEGSKEEAKNRIIKTITELSNKYNTSLATVNRNKGGKFKPALASSI